jgi:glutamate:Na+ symporter, ESS family
MGGFAFAIVIALVHYVADLTITFELARRDILLVYFFAALGLHSNVRELLSNGRPLLLLVASASVFIVLQNVAGITSPGPSTSIRRSALLPDRCR